VAVSCENSFGPSGSGATELVPVAAIAYLSQFLALPVDGRNSYYYKSLEIFVRPFPMSKFSPLPVDGTSSYDCLSVAIFSSAGRWW
jgi:hypothetical protein